MNEKSNSPERKDLSEVEKARKILGYLRNVSMAAIKAEGSSLPTREEAQQAIDAFEDSALRHATDLDALHEVDLKISGESVLIPDIELMSSDERGVAMARVTKEAVRPLHFYEEVSVRYGGVTPVLQEKAGRFHPSFLVRMQIINPQIGQLNMENWGDVPLVDVALNMNAYVLPTGDFSVTADIIEKQQKENEAKVTFGKYANSPLLRSSLTPYLHKVSNILNGDNLSDVDRSDKIEIKNTRLVRKIGRIGSQHSIAGAQAADMVSTSILYTFGEQREMVLEYRDVDDEKKIVNGALHEIAMPISADDVVEPALVVIKPDEEFKRGDVVRVPFERISRIAAVRG